jgi:hypothetical protein
MPLKTYPVLAPVTCRSILIQQSPSFCFQLSANLLCVSEMEHMVSVLQLFPGTLAACTLRRGTHSGSENLITYEWYILCIYYSYIQYIHSLYD